MAFSLRVIQAKEANQIVARGLQSLSNIELVTDIICERHGVTKAQRHNARRQAESIRSCLEQALEYREAAQKSEYAKPTLAYYSIMSFALCEILLKRDGNYRLEKLRQQHAHHGLEFIVASAKRNEDLSAGDLTVRALTRGSFAVWYEKSEQRPIWGEGTTTSAQGSTTGPRILLNAEGEGGDLNIVSLQQLAEICPTTYFESRDLGIQPKLARATIRYQVNTSQKTRKWDLIVHPTIPEIREAVLNKVAFDPRCADLVKVREYSLGGGFTLSAPTDSDYVSFRLPHGFSADGKIVFLRADEIQLNEFGIYYLASYMAGMFARYYPEVWAHCSNTRNKLYLTIDAMMNAAIERVPMLLLEEYRQQIFVLT